MHSSPHHINDTGHSRLFWTVSNSLVLIKRSLTHILRSTDQLLGVLIQPIMFMLLFRYVFGGAIETSGVSYVNFLVAGILIQMAAFGATTTALEVANDLSRGIIDRFKSLPMAASALMTGHVIADLVRNFISSVILIAVAFLVGFRPDATVGEWLLAIALLLCFTLSVSWLSAILGLLAKSIEAVQWMSFLVIFPLTFASGAFVPTSTMPHYVRLFAENQPVTHVIEAIRALLVGTPAGNHILLSFAWSIAIIAISLPIATYLFKRHSAR